MNILAKNEERNLPDVSPEPTPMERMAMARKMVTASKTFEELQAVLGSPEYLELKLSDEQIKLMLNVIDAKAKSF